MAPSGAIFLVLKVFFSRCRWLLSLLVIVDLLGCASGSAPIVAVLSGVAADKLGAGEKSVIPAKPDLAFRYLRIEVEGRAAALLVLGYLDADPQGEIEVWYSSQREVIKTQHGRIVGTAGLETDWRAVKFPSPPPAWTEVPSQGGIYQRLRDEMPGHRYAVADHIEFKPWPGVPAIKLPASLPGDQARTYSWFREATLNTATRPLPPAWFAWGMHRGQPTVVYSEQCLSATFCLKLQRWPVQEAGS